MNQPTIVREKNYGSFVIRWQYVNPAPSDPTSETEPAIVVAPARRSSVRSAWIIMLGSAWKYVDDNDSHSQYMQVASHKICEMLKLGTDLDMRFRVAEAILESLEELINMPPWTLVDNQPKGTIEGHIGEQRIEVEVH